MLQWARLKADGPYPLRRGAWYRITEVLADEVVVDVNRTSVTVPRAGVELSGKPARRWTIVPRPPNALRVPDSWGEWYLVCPGCKHRSPLHAATPTMHCPRCKGLYPVARDERYFQPEEADG
jgi:hypothetical protein